MGSDPRSDGLGPERLFNGNAEFFTLSPIIEAEFANYLQSMGVRPGPNELSVAVETHGQAKVQSVSILDDSGIEVTDLAPPKVKLGIVTPDHLVGVGDAFSLGFRLTNQGGFPAKDVTVRVVYPSGALRALTGEEERFALIEREARGEFRLEALTPGSHKLFVVVSGQSGGQALAAVEAEISDAAQERIAATNPETSSWPAAGLQEWHRLTAAVPGTASLLLLTRSLRRPGSGGSAKR